MLSIIYLYSIFLPIVRKYLLAYQKSGNINSIIFMDLISITTFAIFFIIIVGHDFLGKPSKWIYFLGLYICLFVFGFLALRFMHDSKQD